MITNETTFHNRSNDTEINNYKTQLIHYKETLLIIINF